MSILLFIALMIVLVTALDNPKPKRDDGPAGEPVDRHGPRWTV